MIGATVNVRAGWGDEFAREVNQEARRAVAVAAKHGSEVASGIATQRRRTGAMASMELLDVIGTPDGWEGGFRSEAFYAGFQSRGTLGSRRGKVKQSTLRRRSSPSGAARYAKLSGRAGIAPLGFLEKGRDEARKRLVALLNDI